MDENMKGVLSGKNLLNLTQSAVARHGREQYIISGPQSINASESFTQAIINADGEAAMKSSQVLNAIQKHPSVKKGAQPSWVGTEAKVDTGLGNSGSKGAAYRATSATTRPHGFQADRDL
jgi:hypothetical protein